MHGFRIVITGISGTGKSVLARWLAERTGAPLHHMDPLVWSENWKETDEVLVREALAGIEKSGSWIVEGWIDVYSADILRAADTVLYLDYPGWLAAWGGIRRWWKYRGKKRPEMPEGCIEDFDPRFIRAMLFRKERPHIEGILGKIPEANIVRVRSRREARETVAALSRRCGGRESRPPAAN